MRVAEIEGNGRTASPKGKSRKERDKAAWSAWAIETVFSTIAVGEESARKYESGRPVFEFLMWHSHSMFN
jgi:hypothetical protein